MLVKKININQAIAGAEVNGKSLVIMIAGVSGSGKSTFEKNLIDKYPEIFNKLPQITTRLPREGETNQDYYFVSRETYGNLSDVLIARLFRFNNNKYGTIPVFRPNFANTVIVNAESILDTQKLDSLGLIDVDLVLILFDVNLEDIPESGIREGRDMDFLNNERKNLLETFEDCKDLVSYAVKYNISELGYAEPEDIFII